MFNPQRKSKLSDIYMEERSFQLHLDKMRQIRQSNSPNSLKNDEQTYQKRYLERLHMSKKEVKERLSSDIYKENHRLFVKLIETDTRPEDNPEKKLAKKQHFNSHFNNKKQTERIRNDNYGIINRMLNQTSMVPSLSLMKKDFKQNKRYAKLVRKLPSILKNEEKIKRDLSMNRLSGSKASLTASQQNVVSQRASTQMMNHIESIEQTLVQKQ